MYSLMLQFAAQAAADPAVHTPLSADPTYRAAVIALVVALGGLVTAAAGYLGWLMRERKTKKEAANLPGQAYSLRRHADKKVEEMEAGLTTVKVDVAELKDALSDVKTEVSELTTSARDLADAAEDMGGRVRTIEQGMQTQNVSLAELKINMDWVKKLLEKIEKKLDKEA